MYIGSIILPTSFPYYVTFLLIGAPLLLVPSPRRASRPSTFLVSSSTSSSRSGLLRWSRWARSPRRSLSLTSKHCDYQPYLISHGFLFYALVWSDWCWCMVTNIKSIDLFFATMINYVKINERCSFRETPKFIRKITTCPGSCQHHRLAHHRYTYQWDPKPALQGDTQLEQRRSCDEYDSRNHKYNHRHDHVQRDTNTLFLDACGRSQASVLCPREWYWNQCWQGQ